jgi:hypothetical protein
MAKYSYPPDLRQLEGYKALKGYKQLAPKHPYYPYHTTVPKPRNKTYSILHHEISKRRTSTSALSIDFIACPRTVFLKSSPPLME